MDHDREVRAALGIYAASVEKLYGTPSIPEDEYKKAVISADEARAIVEAAQDRFYRHRMKKSCVNTTTA